MMLWTCRHPPAFDQEINRVSVNLVAANIWVCSARAAIVQSQSEVNKLTHWLRRLSPSNLIWTSSPLERDRDQRPGRWH